MLADAAPSPLSAFLEEHPLTESVDLLLPDLGGILRSKRLPVAGLADALAGHSFFTTSLYALDTTGRNVDHTGLVWDEGDADRAVGLDPRTLRPVPWREGGAQILGALREHDGTPFFADARHLLASLAARFTALGFTPVAALELEFHLVDTALDPSGRPQVPHVPRLGSRGVETEVFAPERMEDQERFFELAQHYCEAQGIALKGALAEFAPSQFEINLTHGHDMVTAADEAIMFKRCIKAAANRTGQRATFMAKPFAHESGSGLHVHLSLVDGDARNVFGETEDGRRLLHWAIGGLQATMAEAMLILAPNANSYRRLRPRTYAPISPTWGTNNRTVALRIPPGAASARRIEHRVAGADANPYLVLAIVLAGILHGLEHRLDPGPETIGNAYDQPAEPLPLTWESAIAAFKAGTTLRSYLGNRLCALYAACREGERDRFHGVITPTEYAWYLAGV